MSEEQIQNIIKNVENTAKEAKTSPEKALNLLVEAGFLDRSGNPTKQYQVK